MVSVRMDQCINRNIVECKEYFCFCVCGSCCGINRNIVECKEPLKLIFDALWNVKKEIKLVVEIMFLVLIETLWNVKNIANFVEKTRIIVLIETLWNVKRFSSISLSPSSASY